MRQNSNSAMLYERIWNRKHITKQQFSNTFKTNKLVELALYCQHCEKLNFSSISFSFRFNLAVYIFAIYNSSAVWQNVFPCPMQAAEAMTFGMLVCFHNQGCIPFPISNTSGIGDDLWDAGRQLMIGSFICNLRLFLRLAKGFPLSDASGIGDYIWDVSLLP